MSNYRTNSEWEVDPKKESSKKTHKDAYLLFLHSVGFIGLSWLSAYHVSNMDFWYVIVSFIFGIATFITLAAYMTERFSDK